MVEVWLEMGSLKEGHLFIKHEACSLLGHTSVQLVSTLTHLVTLTLINMSFFTFDLFSLHIVIIEYRLSVDWGWVCL